MSAKPPNSLIYRLFLAHPAAQNETYGGHFIQAMIYFVLFFSAAMAMIIHAFVPALFTTYGSETLLRIHNSLSARREQTAQNIKS